MPFFTQRENACSIRHAQVPYLHTSRPQNPESNCLRFRIPHQHFSTSLCLLIARCVMMFPWIKPFFAGIPTKYRLFIILAFYPDWDSVYSLKWEGKKASFCETVNQVKNLKSRQSTWIFFQSVAQQSLLKPFPHCLTATQCSLLDKYIPGPNKEEETALRE